MEELIAELKSKKFSLTEAANLILTIRKNTVGDVLYEKKENE